MILSDWNQINYILSLSQILTVEEKEICNKITTNLETLQDLTTIINILKTKYNFTFDCNAKGYYVTFTNKNSADEFVDNILFFDSEKDYKLFKKFLAQ